MTKVASQEIPIDWTLRRVVISLRLLGWAWLVLLVAVVLLDDRIERPAVALAAALLATVWTGITVWVAQSHDRLRNPWFVAADGVVALLIGAASTAAGSMDLFHGGYPISWLAVAAYGGGLAWALMAASALFIEQVLVHDIDDRGLAGTVGSVVFFVFAVALGWAFDSVRRSMERVIEADAALVQAEQAKAIVEQENIRRAERERLANRLHDSVLQTLLVIRRDAADPDHVRYLARRQERQLRHTINEYRTQYPDSFIVAMAGLRDDIEDVHRIEVGAVLRGDAPMTDQLRALLNATREALTNAAKHSGTGHVDLYAAADAEGVQVSVRDRGKGFVSSEPDRISGLAHSIIERVERAGGTVTVSSKPGQGTEIVMEWRPHE